VIVALFSALCLAEDKPKHDKDFQHFADHRFEASSAAQSIKNQLIEKRRCRIYGNHNRLISQLKSRQT